MSEQSEITTPTESASTSASETVSENAAEPTQQPESSVESSPFDEQDGWADFGKRSEADTEESKAEEVKEEPEEVKESIEPKSELSEEDAILEEIFSDEELDALDPNEVIEAQGSRRKKAAARRNFELAEIVKEYTSDKPITDVLGKFEALAPERFKELRETAAHSLVDTNPDGTFQRAFVIKMKQADPSYDWQKDTLPTLDDFIAFKKGEYQPNGNSSNTAQPAELSRTIETLDKTLDFDWRNPENDTEFVDERELALVQTVRALEAQNKTVSEEKERQSKEYEDLKKKIEGLETGFQTETQTKLQSETLKIVNDYRDSVQAKLLPLIAKNTGLEITESDTPEIKSFKERRMMLYTGTPYEQANNQSSAFESFAYNESSVKDEINLITDRIVAAQVKEAEATLAGKTEEAKRHKASADSERIPMMEMLAKANKEFKQLYITPDLELLEKFGSSLSTHINKAAQRVEVATPSAQTRSETVIEAETADDVWGNMVKSAQRDAQLRAA